MDQQRVVDVLLNDASTATVRGRILHDALNLVKLFGNLYSRRETFDNFAQLFCTAVPWGSDATGSVQWLVSQSDSRVRPVRGGGTPSWGTDIHNRVC